MIHKDFTERLYLERFKRQMDLGKLSEKHAQMYKTINGPYAIQLVLFKETLNQV